MRETKIKICGLRRPEDIAYVNEALPDFCGFIVNYEKSHRNVPARDLPKLTSLLNFKIKSVGVFVDEKPEVIAELMNTGVIDICQLHGDEDESYICALKSLISSDANDASKDIANETLIDKIRIIKTFRVGTGFGENEVSRVESCAADLVLLDSGAGSGKTFDWSALIDKKGERLVKRRFILAGGLTPENIGSAIEALHPFGVDISSGVEADKIKDREKILRAVRAARVSRV